MNINKVVILAGGKGTRMRESTSTIPKPMVEIGGIPVLLHIINHFEKFGDFEYIICTGYKEEIIIKYFEKKKYKNIQILPTGLETNTGGRILKTMELIEEDFLMTYGDGLSDININEVMNFHFSHQKTATISVNKPVSRFGLVDFDSKGKVNSFIEKPVLNSYVNMGYMILNPKVYDYIKGDTVFENEPLKSLANSGEIYAYKHSGFFRPMDTHREYLELNDLWEKGNAPWKI